MMQWTRSGSGRCRRLRAAVVAGLGLCALAGSACAQVAGDGSAVIQIWKARRQLELREGETLVRSFAVALGLDPRAAKRIRGDYRTPVGRYYIAEKKPTSRFHRFLGLSYPNIDDADRGYAERLIDATEWASIFLANVRGAPPPWYTGLGGRVGIHGHGGRRFTGTDWTEGCIAVSDEDIDYIYDRVSVGTPVIISE